MIREHLWSQAARRRRGRDRRAVLRVQLSDAAAALEHRRAEQAIAGSFDLFAGLVAAEESTRGQLAADLHDGAAQSIALARAVLSDAGDALGRRSSTAQPEPEYGEGHLDVARAASLIDDGEQQLRAVLARTRPPSLAEADLLAAVHALGKEMSYRYGLETEIVWPAQSHRIPVATAVTVYRFCQEALVNVAKHADGDTAVVRLWLQGNTLCVSVTDGGPGFDPDAVVPAEHGRQIGLELLRERARLAGGSLHVASNRGAGTSVQLRLPLVGRHMPPLVPAATPTPGTRMPERRAEATISREAVPNAGRSSVPGA